MRTVHVLLCFVVFRCRLTLPTSFRHTSLAPRQSHYCPNSSKQLWQGSYYCKRLYWVFHNDHLIHHSKDAHSSLLLRSIVVWCKWIQLLPKPFKVLLWNYRRVSAAFLQNMGKWITRNNDKLHCIINVESITKLYAYLMGYTVFNSLRLSDA